MKSIRPFRAAAFALVLFLALCQSVLAATVSVTRGPYLQTGTPTSVTVRWRTDVPTDSCVRYGTLLGSPTDQTCEATSTTEHVVKLSSRLLPNMPYYYSIGTSTGSITSEMDSTYFFVTSPEEGKAKPTRIWVLGDAGTADSGQQAVRDAYYNYTGSRHTDLWLMLGDNAYSDGTDSQYQSAVFNMYPTVLRKSVLWPTFGNHDAHSADSSSQSGPYYDIFTLPKSGEAGGVASGTEAYYSFNYGNIHFVCLDSSESDRSPSGSMMTWLKADLAANSQPWLIAFWHHPPYSKGSHDSDSESDLQQMRQYVNPVLESYGVDLVLSGHSHAYERSYLLDGHYGTSNTLTSSMILDSGSGRETGSGAYKKPDGLVAHKGAVYAVAGSSGHTSGGSLNHLAMYISLNTLGSMVLDIDGNRLDAVFLDSVGVRGDYFTIVKGSSVTTPPAADFSGTPTSGTAPLQVQFTDLSSRNPASWAWDFQDDGIVDSTVQNPQFIYATPGSYTVKLTATNAAGSNINTKVGYFVVSAPPSPPTADFSGTPTSGTAPLTVQFTDLSSGSPTSWAWDFQNDGTVDSTLQNPQFTYSAAGSYTVKLTVTNGAGSSFKTRTNYITGSAPPPPPGNRLLNSGFELDANNDSKPDNWTKSSKFTRSNAVVRSGNYAGKHFASNNSGYTISQTVNNLAVGTTYRFSGWVNIPLTSDTFTFQFQVRWLNTSNSPIGTPQTIKTYTDDTNGVWDQVEASLVAPEGTANAQVLMVVSSLKATIYVDDLAFGP